jgi:hypoxanthine phosphoribosyltransferase
VSAQETFVEPKLVPLFTEQQIAARIVELGQQIAKDYQRRSLTLVTVLKGSFVFAADLSRAIYNAQIALGLPGSTVTCEFLGLSSYGDETATSGVVRITSDLSNPIEDSDILIVEDIVDTGLTMSYLLENMRTRHPSSIRICSLLHKPSRTQKRVPLDYIGFTIDDLFVVGYGLDYKQRYRNLPWIGVLTL